MSRKPGLCSLLTYCLAGLIAWSAQAQTRLGPDLHLNTNKGYGSEPYVAADSDGVFTAVWLHARNLSGGLQEVAARRFSASGYISAQLALVAGSIPYHSINFPEVALNPDRGWTLFYSQTRRDGYLQVFASRFSQEGSPLGPRFVVSKPLPSVAELSAVERLPSGGYFFVAEDYSCPTCRQLGLHLFARGLDARGRSISPYFQVDTADSRVGLNGAKSLGVDGDGSVIVVWATQQVAFAPKQVTVLGQRFSPTGERLGDLFFASKTIPGLQYAPSVAVNPNGDFVIVWQYQADENAPRSIWARRFSKNGKPIGDEFIVAGDPVSDFAFPSIAADPQGNFIVVWTDVTLSFCFTARGRLYHRDGTPFGPSFPLSSEDSCGELPQVAFGPDGVFGAVWTRDLDDGGSDIFAALFRVDP
jgi:hypothetical protein